MKSGKRNPERSFTLPTNESETVEFKQSFQAEVIETLVAFANAKGGHWEDLDKTGKTGK